MSRLTSLPRPFTALVVGASGGLGDALYSALRTSDAEVWGTARRGGPNFLALDLTQDASMEEVAATMRGRPAPLRLVIVATGLLHDEGLQPEKSLRALDPAHLARSFAINAIGPALVAKHLLPLLPREGKSVFVALSARVGSIDDNRIGGWYGYRASKAALNQLMRTAAIEVARTRPEAILASLHPGTVDTKLSAPFQSSGSARHRPTEAADHLLAVIDGLQATDSGGFFAWDGTSIPF